MGSPSLGGAAAQSLCETQCDVSECDRVLWVAVPAMVGICSVAGIDPASPRVDDRGRGRGAEPFGRRYACPRSARGRLMGTSSPMESMTMAPGCVPAPQLCSMRTRDVLCGRTERRTTEYPVNIGGRRGFDGRRGSRPPARSITRSRRRAHQLPWGLEVDGGVWPPLAAAPTCGTRSRERISALSSGPRDRAAWTYTSATRRRDWSAKS
jgi:hypothetical protein